MASRRFRFANEQGVELAARLDLPMDGTPRAHAVFAHCFTCGKDLKAMAHISRALTRAGIAVLRFDFTGLGDSDGDFSDTTFSTNVSDLVAAANHLADMYQAPGILIGHSLGGAAVLQAAHQLPSVKAVCTIAAPADPGHLTRHFSDVEAAIERDGAAEISLAGRPITITREFIRDLEASRMAETIAGLRRALLIFHSPVDTVVGIDNAARIFTAAKHPKSFVSLDAADHLLSNNADSEYVGAVIAAWAVKYLDASEERMEPPVDDNWVTTRTGAEGYVTDIRAGGHAMVADEPVSVGGTDQGPTPYDYLAAALGACTGMTLRMYADRKQWPLGSVTVKLHHQKVHARDCQECDADDGWVDRIDREIVMGGPLDADQRRRLLEIADRCPVHRTLHSEVVVATSEGQAP